MSRAAIEPLLVSTMDFEHEREYFHSVISKKLDQLCQLKGRRFFPVDLYHRLTEDQLESDDLVQISLDAVRRSAPYFICLIGERYGLHVPPPPKEKDEEQQEPLLHPFMQPRETLAPRAPSGRARRGSFSDFRRQHRRKSLASFAGSASAAGEQQNEWLRSSFRKAAANGYSWLNSDAYTHSSVNDLQTTLAVFLKACPHCFLYVRSAAHQDSLYQNLGEAERERMLKQFEVESEYAAMKVEELKQRLIRKGLNIKFFTTPEELELAIIEDFEQHLGVSYADCIDLPPMSLFDALEREQFIEQELRLRNIQLGSEFSLTSSLLSRFVDSAFSSDSPHSIATAAQHDPLQKFVRVQHSEVMARNHLKKGHSLQQQQQQDHAASILAVVGERGCGKSTLLSHWLSGFQAANQSALAEDGVGRYPGLLTVQYYVGANRSSCDAVNLMELVKQKVHAHFGIRSHEPAFLKPDSQFTYQELVGSFQAALSMGKILLVIDGLDCLGDSIGCKSDLVKRLTWLPNPLPAQCRIICTTLTSDLTHTHIQRRSDVQVHKLQLHTSTHSGREMLENFCSDNGQTLPMEFWENFPDCQLQANPLALMLMAAEFHVIAADANACDRLLNQFADMSTIRQLFLHLLRRWAQEFGWVKLTLMESADPDCPNLFQKEESQIKHEWEDWVSESLALIALSRRGLSLRGLLHLLSQLGYSSQAQVALFDFRRFFNSAAGVLQLVDGRFKFCHLHFAEIIEHIFFGSVTTAAVETRCHATRMPTSSSARHKLHSLLAHHFHEDGDHSEALYHFDRATEFEQVLQILPEPGTFLNTIGWHDSERTLPEAELLEQWQTMESAGFDPLKYFSPYVQQQLQLSLSGYEDFVQLWQQQQQQKQLQELQQLDNDGESMRKEEEEEEEVLIFAASQADAPLVTVDEPPVYIEAADVQSAQLASIPEINVMSASNSDANSSDAALSQEEASAKHQDLLDDLRSVVSDLSSASIDDANVETAIVYGIRLAKILTMLARFEPAGQILMACYRLQVATQAASPSSYDQLSEIAIRIGRLCVATGDEAGSWRWYTTAEEHLKLAITLCDTDPPPADELRQRVFTQYGRLLVRFGELAFGEGRLQDAAAYFRRVKFCHRQSHSITLHASSSHKFGQLHKAMANYSKAASLLEQAFSLYHRWYGLCHPLVADTLLELGQVLADPRHSDVHNQLRAEACLRCCVSIRERCLGHRHQQVAEPLLLLGAALLQTGDGLNKAEVEAALMRAADVAAAAAADAAAASVGGGGAGEKNLSKLLQKITAQSQTVEALLRLARSSWSGADPSPIRRTMPELLHECRQKAKQQQLQQEQQQQQQQQQRRIRTPPKARPATAAAAAATSTTTTRRLQRPRSARLIGLGDVDDAWNCSSSSFSAMKLVAASVAEQRRRRREVVEQSVLAASSAERKFFRRLFFVRDGDSSSSSIGNISNSVQDSKQIPHHLYSSNSSAVTQLLRIDGHAAGVWRQKRQQQQQQRHAAAWWHEPGRYSTSEAPYPPRRSQLMQRLQLKQR